MDDIHLIANIQEIKELTNMFIEILSHYGSELSNDKCKYLNLFLDNEEFDIIHYLDVNRVIITIDNIGSEGYIKSLGFYINGKLNWNRHFIELYNSMKIALNNVCKGYASLKDT